MRRLFAYIIVAIALVVGIFVGTPTIKDSTKPGAEFDGGYTILYRLTDQEGENFYGNDLTNKKEKAIENINDRLKALNILDPTLDVEESTSDKNKGNTYFRATVPTATDSQLNTIKYVVSNIGGITVRDAEDKLLCDGEEAFEEVALQVTGGATVLTIKLADNDVFHDVTENLAANASQQEGEEQSPNLFIWLGFEEEYPQEVQDKIEYTGDKFSEIDFNPISQTKLLTAMAVTEHVESDFYVQALVSEGYAEAYNEIIKQGPTSYKLTEVNSSKIGSYYKESAMNKSLLAITIGLIIIAALLIVTYRYAGITASLSIIACSVGVFALYNAFGGLFGAETLLAFIVGIGLAVDANVVILERCRDEIRKGKTIARAFEEGSKKSVSTILDSNVIVIIAAFALYLFGQQAVKSFSALLIISQVAIIVVVILLTRLMLSFFCHSSLIEGKPQFFGVKEDEISDKNATIEEKAAKQNKFAKVSFVGGLKKKSIISGGIVAVGIVFAILFQIISGSAFNYTSNVKKGTRIFFRTVDPTMSEVANVEEFFASEDMVGSKYSPTKIIIGEDKEEISADDLHEYQEIFKDDFHLDIETVSRNTITVYTVEVFYNELSETAIDSVNAHFEALSEKVFNLEEDIDILDMAFNCGEFEPTSGSKTIVNAIFAIAMLCAFAIVYLTIRFTFAYSLSAILSTIHNELIFFALLAITRLSIGTWAVAGGLAIAVLTLGNTCITFDKLRENVGEAKQTIWTIDTRKEFINKSLQQTMYGHLFSNVATLIVAILVLCLAGFKTMPIGIVAILTIVAAAYGSYFVMPLLWAHLDTVLATAKANRKAKRAEKNKNKPALDAGQPEEYTFFGIND